MPKKVFSLLALKEWSSHLVLYLSRLNVYWLLSIVALCHPGFGPLWLYVYRLRSIAAYVHRLYSDSARRSILA